jgi:hypothetical protein
MKTLLKTFAILFISLITISCSNSNNDTSNPQNPTPSSDYFFKAKIDGVTYNHTGPSVAASPKSNGGIRILSSIVGVGSFNFEIDNVRTAGTYPSSSVGGAPFARMSYGDGTGASFAPGFCGNTGQLIITSRTATEVVGTFTLTVTPLSGTCPRPTKVITEGSFRCQYAE